jgi:hypothetical protein
VQGVAERPLIVSPSGLPAPPLPPPPPAPTRRGAPAPLIVVAVVVGLALIASLVGRAVLHAGEVTHGPHAFLEQLSDGTPYRWNPCQPIHYVVNPDHEPAGAPTVVQEAIHRVSTATGIRFIDDGTTVETADQQIGSVFQTTIPGPRYLPLLITFVTGNHFNFLADTRRAIAFGMPYRGDGDAVYTYVSGVVVVDTAEPVPVDFATRYSLGPVLMHELGHVMGLAHVGAADELMWSPTVRNHAPSPDLSQTDWGPGDLEGLRLLGRSAGCLPAR